MLVKPPIEELLKRVENRYTLAIATAKRARQLVDGGKILVDSKAQSLVTIACEELEKDKYAAIPDFLSPYIPPSKKYIEDQIREAEQARYMEEEFGGEIKTPNMDVQVPSLTASEQEALTGDRSVISFISSDELNNKEELEQLQAEMESEQNTLNQEETL